METPVLPVSIPGGKRSLDPENTGCEPLRDEERRSFVEDIGVPKIARYARGQEGVVGCSLGASRPFRASDVRRVTSEPARAHEEPIRITRCGRAKAVRGRGSRGCFQRGRRVRDLWDEDQSEDTPIFPGKRLIGRSRQRPRGRALVGVGG